LCARYYVQQWPTDPRIVQTISLGSPFNGTSVATWMPKALCKDLRPDSHVIASLKRSSLEPLRVPHSSIATKHDQLVKPWQSALFSRGTTFVFSTLGHNSLLFDQNVADTVVSELRRCINSTAQDRDFAQPFFAIGKRLHPTTTTSERIQPNL
jgi:hypothetical protein